MASLRCAVAGQKPSDTGEPRQAAGLAWGKGTAARCPRSRTVPQHGRWRAGGAGWRWRPQPPETRPGVGSQQGGVAPAPKPQARETHSRRAKQGPRRSRSPRCVQRHGVSGFPARGAVREADRGRRGAPSPFGTWAASRRPSCRPTVQGGDRQRWPSAAQRLFVSPIRLPP